MGRSGVDDQIFHEDLVVSQSARLGPFRVIVLERRLLDLRARVRQLVEQALVYIAIKHELDNLVSKAHADLRLHTVAFQVLSLRKPPASSPLQWMHVYVVSVLVPDRVLATDIDFTKHACTALVTWRPRE